MVDANGQIIGGSSGKRLKENYDKNNGSVNDEEEEECQIVDLQQNKNQI